MEKILIIGATSAIAKATARLYAQQGCAFYLVARNADKLARLSQDLEARGASLVATTTLDVNSLEQHPGVITAADKALAGIDIALIAHGTLPDQKACESNLDETLQEIQTNALSVISFLTHLANYFESKRRGSLVVISSVAGDRGRQSNYVYGTAKAAVTTFMQGLRNRLDRFNVHVMTVKPGFVDTPMTESFDKGLLWTQPSHIAEGIINGVRKKKNTVYLPWFWRWIMLVIKLIPEMLFKKLRL